MTSDKQLKSSLFIIAYSNTHNKFNLLSHAKKINKIQYNWSTGSSKINHNIVCT